MPKLFIQLYPEVRRQVARVVSDIVEGTSTPPAVRLPDEDEDLAFWWLSSLKEVMEKDCATLQRVLESSAFGKGHLQIPDEGAERILRACSAVRLRIQQLYLKNISPEALEQGKMELNDLTDEQRPAFLSYLVLAHLQEKIVEAMDPEYGAEA